MLNGVIQGLSNNQFYEVFEDVENFELVRKFVFLGEAAFTIILQKLINLDNGNWPKKLELWNKKLFPY